jgi:hypothetical protein
LQDPSPVCVSREGAAGKRSEHRQRQSSRRLATRKQLRRSPNRTPGGGHAALHVLLSASLLQARCELVSSDLLPLPQACGMSTHCQCKLGWLHACAEHKLSGDISMRRLSFTRSMSTELARYCWAHLCRDEPNNVSRSYNLWCATSACAGMILDAGAGAHEGEALREADSQHPDGAGCIGCVRGAEQAARQRPKAGQSTSGGSRR